MTTKLALAAGTLRAREFRFGSRAEVHDLEQCSAYPFGTKVGPRRSTSPFQAVMKTSGSDRVLDDHRWRRLP
jgi:hypothetical protein